VMRNTGVQAKVGIVPVAIRKYYRAWDKFLSPPFEQVYLNGTYELEGSFIEGREWSGKWTAVFSVNWTYIEENYVDKRYI